MRKTLLLLAAFCLMARGACAAELEYFPVSGNIAVGSDNLTRIDWTLSNGGTWVQTYNSSGTLITSGSVYGPYSGWESVIAAGSSNIFSLAWFSPGTQQFGNWTLNASNSMQGLSTFQTATPPSGLQALGPAHFYGYAMDVEGNGIFGFDWETAVYNQICGNVYSTAGPNVQNYTYTSSGQDSLGLGYSAVSGPHQPDGTPINLNVNGSGATTAFYMGTSEDVFAVPYMQGWHAVAITVTPNNYVQIWWSGGSNQNNYLAIWNISPSGAIVSSPLIQLGSSTFASAAANPFSGDGNVRMLLEGQYGGWSLDTINPSTWAVTTSQIPGADITLLAE